MLVMNVDGTLKDGKICTVCHNDAINTITTGTVYLAATPMVALLADLSIGTVNCIIFTEVITDEQF